MAPFGFRQLITRMVPSMEILIDIILVITIVRQMNLFIVIFAALCIDSLTARVFNVS